MANRKLRIGCVLLVGGALTNGSGIVGCGSVGTPAEPNHEQGTAGGSGSVGVPPDGGYAGDDEVPGGGGSDAAGTAGLAGEGGYGLGGEVSVQPRRR